MLLVNESAAFYMELHSVGCWMLLVNESAAFYLELHSVGCWTPASSRKKFQPLRKQEGQL